MKLYRVTDNGINARYIMAASTGIAINKYIEVSKYINGLVGAKYICMRDDIIPTLDPQKEFININ